jgi:integrase
MESDLLRSGGRDGGSLSPRTVLQSHRVLSSALKHALKMGLLSRDIMALVEPPRISRHEVRALSWEECLLFLRSVDDPLFHTLFLLAVQTGLRRSEVVGLQWRDVDLDGAMLSVRRALVKLPSGGVDLTVPKSGVGRVVDLPGSSVRALRAYLEFRPGNGEFVFCHSDGRFLDPNLLSRVFRRFAAKVGLVRVRFHDLRHTHASLLLSEGVHLKVVSERLGHSSIAITGDIYSHVLPTVQRGAADRFDAAWSDWEIPEIPWKIPSDDVPPCPS